MYAHCIRSWRLLGHSRHSPLSLLRGFALEPLKVLFVCTRTAAVRSAWTAVEGTRSNLGCGSSSTLGFLQRSLVVTLPFVPWRRIYWRYVVEPVDVAMLCECLCLSQPAQFPIDPTREMLCHIHKRMLLCVIMSRSLISLLPRLIKVVWVCLRGLRNASRMGNITSNKEACHRGGSGGRGLKGDY